MPFMSSRKVLKHASEGVEDTATAMVKKLTSPQKTTKKPRKFASPLKRKKVPKKKPEAKLTSKFSPSTFRMETTFKPHTTHHRGRMLWGAFLRNQKGGAASIFRFISPAMVGGGSFSEQQAQARCQAVNKAAGLMGMSPQEIIVIQAGGFGRFYDDEDKALGLP